MMLLRELFVGVAKVGLGLVIGLGAGCGGGAGGKGAETSTDGQEHGPGHGEATAHHGHHGKRFEDAEQWAKVFDDPARDAWQKPDEVVALLRLAPGMTVVDLGAGTGYFLSRLSRAVGPGGQVVATDIEPDMVRYMEDRIAKEQLGNAHAVLAPQDGVGVPDGTADRILVVDVWHHIPDRARYAAALGRALKPGGELHIVDFTLEASHGPPREHRLTPAQVIAELEAGGLVGEVAAEPLPDQYVVIGRAR